MISIDNLIISLVLFTNCKSKINYLFNKGKCKERGLKSYNFNILGYKMLQIGISFASSFADYQSA